jgi:UDP-arabinose 4-epimerase
VFHFAALAYVGESVVLPDQYYSVNVAGTLALLTAMREASVTRIVFSSSCATYGIPGSVPIDEGQQQRPINPYGRTKLIGEQILSDHSAAFSLDYAILRYFNAAGCDPDGDLVERHDPETHLIPRALMAAGRFGPSLQVLGTDYNTPDGTAIRDYIHVSDLAMAHWLTYVSLLQGKGPIILNLGTGRGKSVREIVDTVQRISGLRVPIVNGPRRLGDPPVLVAATDRSTTILDFSPRYSDLETIVGTAWRGVQSVYGKRRR